MLKSLVAGSCLLMLSVLTAVLTEPLYGQSNVQQASPGKEQLAQWLQQYPAADANQDGELTVEEAEAYRRQLMRQARSQGRNDFRSEFTFATMSDGVQIALAVGYPPGCDPQDATHKWPAVFEMMGYPGSTIPQSPQSFGNRYVTVRASVRGAGASGGTIHAISPQTAQDGYEVIEQWIVTQPWSNGRVALHGHSWGGLTGFMVAATNPPHLRAVAVSGLLDDIYRDIGSIGGIRNAGFPVHWLVNLYRPEGPFGSGEAAIEARGLSREAYQQIVDARPPWDLQQSVLWKSLSSQEALPEFALASPGTFAPQIRVPIHIMHAYQDEQTGPSGVWLWSHIPDDVPKHLVLSNGDHGDVGRFTRQRMEWLDFWTLQEGMAERPEFTDRDCRVEVHFETSTKSDSPNEPLRAADFPLPGTQWTRYYLAAKERLQLDKPSDADEVADRYRVEVAANQKTPAGCHYALSFDAPTAICGPIAAQLWVRCDTVDTDLYLVVADVDSEGTVQLLQRGLLRASHRALDGVKSWKVNVGDETLLVRPRHTHQNPTPLVPGEAYRLDVEIFPVGHVFRPGHQLTLWISQPPRGDPVTRNGEGQPSYIYASDMPPATVSILRSAEYPSSLLLPILPTLPPIKERSPGPGQQAGISVY